MPELIQTKQQNLKQYDGLRERVRETLAKGRQKARSALEGIAIESYWECGRLIQRHVGFHRDRAQYEQAVVVKLAKQLNENKTRLYDGFKIAKAYPIFPPVGRLGIRHYRTLARIENSTERKTLEKKVIKEKWSTRKLEAFVRKHFKVRADFIPTLNITAGIRPTLTSLRPKRGRLHHYRILRKKSIHRKTGALVVDFGFRYFPELRHYTNRTFSVDTIVEITPGKRPEFQKRSSAVKRDLYAYQGFTTNVIDGDTVWAMVDFGIGGQVEHKLRFRGIDAPDVKTPAGLRAKRFLEDLLNKDPVITVTTRKGKFDRYEADVFWRGIFLNQYLIDKGHARRAMR